MDALGYPQPDLSLYSPSLSHKSSHSSMTPSDPHDFPHPQQQQDLPLGEQQPAHPIIVPPTVNLNMSPTEQQKPKRKRSRVTPAQLVHLEKFFACERSPSADRRKEISELLGMQERQTQIWFQNRRAKAKVAGNNKTEGGVSHHSGHTPPSYALENTAFTSHLDLVDLAQDDQPILPISCHELLIGTWRRVVLPEKRDDLLAYISKGKQRLTWLVRSSGYAFRMDVPFSILQNVTIQPFSVPRAPGGGPQVGLAIASLFLSKPTEDFYLRDFHHQQDHHQEAGAAVQGGGGHVIQEWKRCLDWTEGRQASGVQKIDIIGSTGHLSGFVQFLRQVACIDVIQHQHHQHQQHQQQRLSAAYPSSNPLSHSTFAGSEYISYPPPAHEDHDKLVNQYMYMAYGSDTTDISTELPPPITHRPAGRTPHHPETTPTCAQQPAPISVPVLPQLDYHPSTHGFYGEESSSGGVYTPSNSSYTAADSAVPRSSPPLLTTPFHPRLDSIGGMQAAYYSKGHHHLTPTGAAYQQAYIP